MRWRAAAAPALIVAAAFGVASAVSATADNRTTTIASTETREVRPPIPHVSTLGVTRAATLVSYCWTVALPGGGVRGTCADGNPGHAAHVLLWRPGVKLHVDLRLPAHKVHVQLARFGRAGKRSGRIVGVRVERLDASGRRWMLRLPRKAQRDTDLLISAYFGRGDVYADVGIRRAEPPAPPDEGIRN